MKRTTLDSSMARILACAVLLRLPLPYWRGGARRLDGRRRRPEPRQLDAIVVPAAIAIPQPHPGHRARPELRLEYFQRFEPSTVATC